MSTHPVPRLICDEMLQRLGRWLRAAGYDTLIAEPGMRDRELMDSAHAEKRWLLTRDRKLMEFRHAAGHVILLHGNELDDNLSETGERLAINWLLAPFSRCLVCNTPIESRAADVSMPVPADILESQSVLYYCPHCDQYFWEGSHVRRMRNTLEKLASRS